LSITKQHLLHETDVAALLGHEGQRGGHVATHRVAGHRDASGVQAVGGAVCDDPPGDRVILLDGDGIARFGRQVVLGKYDGGSGADGQFAHQAVVGVGAAEHPARTMNVNDHRQRPGRAGRPDDAGAY
jgi:hypothetical protein